MSQKDYELGLPLWTVASKFLNLVTRTATEIAAHGNPTGAVSNRPLTAEEIQERTQWSDTDLSVPMLFDFYHGLEVMMKGFLVAEGQPGKGHKLSKLLEQVISLHPKEPVFQITAKYIDSSQLPSPLREFFDENGITPDSFYEVFKYPEMMNGKLISHHRLKYGGESGARFYRQLSDDAEQINRLSARLANTSYPRTPTSNAV